MSTSEAALIQSQAVSIPPPQETKVIAATNTIDKYFIILDL